MHVAGGALDAIDQDTIPGRAQIGVVADMHDRHEKAEFARHLPAHRAQPTQQAAVAILADEADQSVADLDFQRLDQLDDADIDLGRLRWRRRGRRRLRRRASVRASSQRAVKPRQPGEQQKRHMRHAGHQPEQADDPGREPPSLRKDRELRDDLIADVVLRSTLG